MYALLAVALAWAQEPLRGPLQEVEHPLYKDAEGKPVTWREVKDLARGSDAMRRVRSRRLGRTVLRFTFLGVTGVEAWGTVRLAQQRNYLAPLLGVQTASTGLCAVLLWTSAPNLRREDRAMILDGANGVLTVAR